MFKITGHSIKLLLLVCLWPTSCTPAALLGQQSDGSRGAAELHDPIYPYLGNGGYDVTHYAIALMVDMASDTIIRR